MFLLHVWIWKDFRMHQSPPVIPSVTQANLHMLTNFSMTSSKSRMVGGMLGSLISKVHNKFKFWVGVGES